MTNSERRVGLSRRALDPPGEALADWEIFALLGRALGHRDQFAWRSAAEVFDEYAATTEGRVCDLSGLSHALLGGGTLQWPVPARDGVVERGGTERLYTSSRFPTPTGRARFVATPHRAPADHPSPDFPLILTTGRIANQWHTMTRTAKSPDLMTGEPEPFLELNPVDATAARAADGELVRVRSRHGHAILRARVTAAVPAGSAFAPFHWGALHLRAGHSAVNAVVPRALDPESRQAELKAAAIRVEALPVEPTATFDRARPRAGARRRLLVIGTGMAGMATVDALLEHEGADGWEITMVGREPDLPYNRILLSKVVAGTADEAQLALHEPEWHAERSIEILPGREVRALNIAQSTAELDDGDELAFDRVVLATGSRPAMPPLTGVDLRGVHPFRTLHDARRIIAAAATAGRAVVIGGGLLGLEVARGLRAHQVDVTVVHAAPWLMERQLDPSAAALLQRSLEELGVAIRLGASARALLGAGAVTGVALESGEECAADLVVIAAGVIPEVSLATDAGLEVERGIVVDDQLRTSAPGVYAVGECAQHRDVVYGMWAPLHEQANVAAAALAGSPAAFRGAIPATTLKVAGVDLFCGGDPTAAPGDDEVIALDTRNGRYRRLLLRGDRLVGTILLGDLRDARTLREQLASAQPVPETLLAPIPAGVAAPAACLDDPAATLCTCMSVTQRAITTAIGSLGLETVEQVGRHTRAGTGCGTCRTEIGALLDARRGAADRTNEIENSAAAA
jgi:ferredoxin-nitrate reductase